MKIWRITRYAGGGLVGTEPPEGSSYLNYGHGYDSTGICEGWVYNPDKSSDLIRLVMNEPYRSCPLHNNDSIAMKTSWQRYLQGRIDHNKKIVTIVIPRNRPMGRLEWENDEVGLSNDEIMEQLLYVESLFKMDYPDYRIYHFYN